MFAKKALDLLDPLLLSNPQTTYSDLQCGTGTLMLHLVDRLMSALEEAIPNEIERLEHIFSNQISCSDIDQLQTLVCSTNFKKALNNKTFKVNVECKDFKDVTKQCDVIISGIDFETTNDFVEHARKIATNVLVLTRPNKNRYTKSPSINEITKYRYLGSTSSATPISAMLFTDTVSDSVEFVTDDESYVVKNPPYLPGHNLKGFAYVQEILNQNFNTFDATYGSYYINAKEIVNNPGDVELIFQVGAANKPFKKTVSVDNSIITPREGVGVHKVVISKNGNRGRKTVLKYAEPKYGTGHNAIWIGMKDKEEAERVIKYYNSPAITALILSITETSPANGIGFWNKIPHYTHEEDVKKIFAKYY